MGLPDVRPLPMTHTSFPSTSIPADFSISHTAKAVHGITRGLPASRHETEIGHRPSASFLGSIFERIGRGSRPGSGSWTIKAETLGSSLHSSTASFTFSSLVPFGSERHEKFTPTLLQSFSLPRI